MKTSELIKSPAYWTQDLQIELYNTVTDYLERNHISRTQFAEQLGVSKGYVSQILNGEFDHKLSKLVSLSLACGMIPRLTFVPMELMGNSLKFPVQNMFEKPVFSAPVRFSSPTIEADRFTVLPFKKQSFEVA